MAAVVTAAIDVAVQQTNVFIAGISGDRYKVFTLLIEFLAFRNCVVRP